MHKKILFIPLDAHGHVNACLGIAQILLGRGHQVIFAVDKAWQGKLESKGFEEEIHCVHQEEEDKITGEEVWPNFIAKNSHFMGVEPFAQLELIPSLPLRKMFDNHKAREQQIQEIINRVNPDIIVVDNYICSPAIVNSPIPWVWLCSAAPLGAIPDETLPPPHSGYSLESDKALWIKFKERQIQCFQPLFEEVNEWVVSLNAPPLPIGCLHPPSPHLNLYMYPEEIDFLDVRPLPENWHRLDTMIRISDETFEIPGKLKNRPGKLIYLAMGSFASSGISLMTRLVDIFKSSPHRIIFVKGLLGDRYELADNMWGDNSLPQTKIIPLVDLVVTHGGNNTVTETFFFGKPMIVMPLFMDQYDNAQRIEDKGFGYRFNPYTCSAEEVHEAIEKLLNNQELHDKLKIIAQRIQSSNSTEKAADLIEEVDNQ